MWPKALRRKDPSTDLWQFYRFPFFYPPPESPHIDRGLIASCFYEGLNNGTYTRGTPLPDFESLSACLEKVVSSFSKLGLRGCRIELTMQGDETSLPAQQLGILVPNKLPDLPSTDLVLQDGKTAQLQFHYQGTLAANPEERQLLKSYHVLLVRRWVRVPIPVGAVSLYPIYRKFASLRTGQLCQEILHFGLSGDFSQHAERSQLKTGHCATPLCKITRVFRSKSYLIILHKCMLSECRIGGPSTKGATMSYDGVEVPWPEAGALVVPLVVPLVCNGGEWLVDWDTLHSAASLPKLSTDLPQEALQVQVLKALM